MKTQALYSYYVSSSTKGQNRIHYQATNKSPCWIFAILVELACCSKENWLDASPPLKIVQYKTYTRGEIKKKVMEQFLGIPKETLEIFLMNCWINFRSSHEDISKWISEEVLNALLTKTLVEFLRESLEEYMKKFWENFWKNQIKELSLHSLHSTLYYTSSYKHQLNQIRCTKLQYAYQRWVHTCTSEDFSQLFISTSTAAVLRSESK